MKKLLLLIVGIIFLTGACISQDALQIGTVKDGKLTITNEKALKAYFLNILGYSGNIGKDIKVEASPERDRFFVSAKVEDNKNQVSSIGVLLVVQGQEAVITEARPEEGDSSGPGPGIGGSMNVQCVGAPCGICFPELEWNNGQWYPYVRCLCFDAQGKCNSTVSFTVNLNVGM